MPLPKRTLAEHLDPKAGPKRILALDGGGVRGALTLEYLAKIEDILGRRYDDADLRLCDYFDLIGGTSTGAIIAAGLALGWRVDRLRKLYDELAGEVFEKPLLRMGLFLPKFGSQRLKELLEREFRDPSGHDRTFGSGDIRTGLMIMLKRMDTGSPWPLHNNPAGKYYAPKRGGSHVANSEYLLRAVVRASTAAPHYFDPEELDVANVAGKVDRGVFIDGGVSPANNPALQLLMLASLKGYRLGWELGEENILICSVGTGSEIVKIQPGGILSRLSGELALVQALTALQGLMGDCDALNQTMLQWMSNSPTARKIDSEIGDLSGDLLGGRKLLSYLRYNVMLDRDWLAEHIDYDLPYEQVAGLNAMDKPGNVPLLRKVGAKAASKQCRPTTSRRASISSGPPPGRAPRRPSAEPGRVSDKRLILGQMARERDAGHPVAAVDGVRSAGSGPLDPHVVVVDLDGSLIRTDLLVEGLTAHLGQNPLRLPGALALLRRGKAHLKRAMADRHGVQADRLPYNDELIEELQRRKQQGAFLVLATAADSELAQAVAEELGLFDAVVATSDGVNRRGALKLEAVRGVIGEQRFLFVGDDVEDRALFDAADAVILVDPPEALRRDLDAAGKLRRVIRTGKNSFGAMLRLLRPHQWTKNLLILAPAVAGHRLFDWATLQALLLAIVAFSLAASTIYILNDALDVRADRAHPVKRRRPLASGAVRLPRAAMLGLALATASLLVAAMVGTDFLALLLVYAAVSTAYSMWLKSLLVVDLFTLVSLYILRLAAGHLAGGIAYSFWFMMFFFLMLMGLALLKRYSETKMLDSRGLSCVEGRAYLAADTPILAAAGASSMMASVVIMALYLQSEAVKELYSSPLRLTPLCAVVLFVALRLWLLASRSELEKDPILHLASDPYTYALGAIAFAFVYLAS